MSLNKFLADTLIKCQENSINFKLFSKKSHEGSAGFFDEKNLVSCSKRPDWVSILVHESCHMDQFLEESRLWGDPDNDFDIWSKKNAKIDPKRYTEEFKLTLKLEIDCDRRAVQKIKDYNLQKYVGGLARYIRAANCYHGCYYYFRKLLAFYKAEKTPYSQPELLKLFPPNRIMAFEESWKANPPLGNYLKKYKKDFK